MDTDQRMRIDNLVCTGREDQETGGHTHRTARNTHVRMRHVDKVRQLLRLDEVPSRTVKQESPDAIRRRRTSHEA